MSAIVQAVPKLQVSVMPAAVDPARELLALRWLIDRANEHARKKAAESNDREAA